MSTIRGMDFNFSAMINGNREILCYATDFILNTTADMIETTGPNNGAWRSFRPGLLSYTISVPGLVSYTENFNIVQLQEIQYGRQLIEWFAAAHEDGGLTYHGFAYINTINNTHQMRDSVKFDMSAQGTGPQDILKLPRTKTVPLTDLSGVPLVGCPNPYPVGVLWYDGTFIGPASNVNEYISVFNAYANMQNAKIQLTTFVNNCSFNMQIEWDSIYDPNFVPAVAAEGFAIRGTADNEALGGTFDTNEIISA